MVRTRAKHDRNVISTFGNIACFHFGTHFLQLDNQTIFAYLSQSIQSLYVCGFLLSLSALCCSVPKPCTARLRPCSRSWIFSVWDL